MKNRICICNTYFQLIECIQLKLTIFKADNVSIVLSDHSNCARQIYDKIMEIDIFDECYYIETKKFIKNKRTVKHKLNQLFCIVNGNDKIWQNYTFKMYDELIYYSQLDEVYTLYAKLSKINPKIKVSRYEEGIFSYEGGEWSGIKVIIANRLRRILGKTTLESNFKNFYCFYPELYNGHLNSVLIPPIDEKSQLKRYVKKIFNVKENAKENYHYRYLYFSSVYDFEGGKSINELELVKKISQIVGNDNLLVKVHPRDDAKRFSKEGLNVDINSNIPWEAIQLGNDFSDTIFLTVNSSSVLSISLLESNPPIIYYMYNLCDIKGNKSATKSVEAIQNLLNSHIIKDSCLKVSPVTRLEDIL